MSILATMLQREQGRNENMISAYSSELLALPKGSIRTKKNGDKIYYYLSFRDGDRIVTQYIGKTENELTHIKEQLERRKQVECILKKLREEQEQIKKMEALL